MRRTIWLLTGWMFFAGVVRAQNTPSAELSASYSAFRLNGVDGFTLNGGSLSLAGNVNHWFGVAGNLALIIAISRIQEQPIFRPTCSDQDFPIVRVAGLLLLGRCWWEGSMG